MIKFKSHLYFEEKDKLQENLKSLKTLRGSKILFFLNGKPLGEAFTDIYGGDYYPAIATYKHARVKVNFGPKFRCPPQITKTTKWKPMSARGEEATVEQTLSDMKFFTEYEGRLTLRDYVMSP